MDAFEAAEWLPLLEHNFADIKRTRDLSLLAGRFVAKSDFGMKNLQPPGSKSAGSALHADRPDVLTSQAIAGSSLHSSSEGSGLGGK